MSEMEYESNTNKEASYLSDKEKFDQKKDIEKKYTQKNRFTVSILEFILIMLILICVAMTALIHIEKTNKNSEENINNKKVLIKEDLMMHLTNKNCLVPGDISIFKGVNERAVVKLNNNCVFEIENRMSSEKYLWINDFVKYSVINENNVIDIKMENIEKD